MEEFEYGDHVIVEVEDPKEGTRLYGGFLLDLDMSQVTLKTTHKEMPVVHVLSDRIKGNIRTALADSNTVKLKLEGVRRLGVLNGILTPRKELLVDLQAAREEYLLEDYDDSPTWKELDAPVLTLLNRDHVKSIESTDDRQFGLEIAAFGETAAAGFEELLKEEAEKTKEDNEGTESISEGTSEGP